MKILKQIFTDFWLGKTVHSGVIFTQKNECNFVQIKLTIDLRFISARDKRKFEHKLLLFFVCKFGPLFSFRFWFWWRKVRLKSPLIVTKKWRLPCCPLLKTVVCQKLQLPSVGFKTTSGLDFRSLSHFKCMYVVQWRFFFSLWHNEQFRCHNTKQENNFRIGQQVKLPRTNFARLSNRNSSPTAASNSFSLVVVAFESPAPVLLLAFILNLS